MHDPSGRNPAYRALSDQQLSEIDGLCDRFDQELVKGDAPRIETFLTAVPDAARDGLLAELLAMEVEYRTQQGEKPRQEEYLRRFPQQEHVIAGVIVREAMTLVEGEQGTISLPVSVPPVLANFRLIKELGHGGMGVVWLAEQDQPVKRRVALKLVRSELTANDVIARFETEKQALAMMDHPSIARVLDAGTTADGRPFFVMELVDGIPITQYCDEHKLSVDERLKLLVHVCKAVQHAHQKGIVHRDLKPSNVLVTVIDGEAVPKVIDFGLAKAVAPDLRISVVTMETEFGRIVGTVQYMSPEQAELKGPDAEDIDTRTDVYSLGVMLYELLTGSTPLDEETLRRNAVLKVLQIIREQDPPRPSSRLSSSSQDVSSAVSDLRRLHPARLQQLLRGELDWVVMKSLEKDRNRRYQTASDLAQDLTNYLTGAAVTARPPSTWYQLQKFARRNRGVVSALLAVAVALLAGMAGTTYGLFQATEKARVAEQKTRETEDERRKAKASEQRALTEKANARSNEQRAIEAEKLADLEAGHARDAEASAKFQLAMARYDANRAMDARSLLHEIPPQYRNNFEWHCCNRRFEGSDVTCYGHTSEVRAVAFMPDGNRVVSADSEGKIKLWDAATGRGISTFAVHRGRVRALAVTADGQRIAAAGDSRTVVVRDAGSAKIVLTLTGHRGSVNSVAFSPTGDLIASASEDKTVRIWDAASGETISIISDHTAAVKGLAFSPDGKQLASAGTDQLIRIRDTQTWKPVKVLQKHNIEVQSVAFSPDGTRLSASSYGYVSLWDTQTWTFMTQTGGHDGFIRFVCFSPDATLFATAGDESRIKLWDAQSGRIIRTLSGHGATVWCVAFSPNGSRLVSGSKDGTVRIWDASGKERTAGVDDRGADNSITLPGHAGQIFSVAYSPDGTQLASAGQQGTILLRNAQTSEVVLTLQGHAGDSIGKVCFSPDGTRLASAGDDGTVRLWDTRTGQETAVLKADRSSVRGVAFSPDGSQLASGGRDGFVRLWDAQTGEVTATLKGHRDGVYSVAFSPDGSCLASASADKTVRLWDARTGDEIRILTGHTGRVRTVAFDAAGERIASGGYDLKVRVWNVASGGQVATAHIRSGTVWDLAFSPDGQRLAVGNADMEVKLVDAAAGNEIMNLYLGNAGGTSVAFSPDGKRLAVAVGGIGRVRIFDAQQQHEAIHLCEHQEAVTRVTFSADGTRIYSECEHEKRVWDVATQATIPDALWEPPTVSTHSSPDGRFFVTAESNHVVLVDREFGGTPDENAWRTAKARFAPLWHQERAKNSATAEHWYAAVFHYALVMQNDPDQAAWYDGLQAAHQQLASQCEQSGRDLASLLPGVVRESLRLPRGEKLPEVPAADARNINNSVWARVSSPAAFERAPLTDSELTQFRELVQQHPRRTYYNTLSTAEFRMGHYQQARDAALKSVELSDEVFPGDYAVLAMSCSQLGDADNAQRYRDKFVELMTQEQFKNSDECRSFAAEMEKAFESPAR